MTWQTLSLSFIETEILRNLPSFNLVINRFWKKIMSDLNNKNTIEISKTNTKELENKQTTFLYSFAK